MAVLSDTTTRRVMTAVGDATAGNEVATSINRGDAIATQAALIPVLAITATNVSTTIDFGALQVGDRVLAIATGAGGAVNGYLVATAGTLPAAAVVGSVYLVFRAPVLAVSAVKF